jgi:subtilisin family serine protease
MRRSLSLLAALALILASVSLVSATPAAGSSGYIVSLRPGTELSTTINGLSQRLAFVPDHVYSHALRGFAASLNAQQVAALAADPAVRTIVADQAVEAIAQTLPTGINRIQADASSQASGNGSDALNLPAVAVIDTGIDTNHPDLNVVGGKNCSSGRSFEDGNGHGTHVAGTIGARDDASGVVGVAPGVPLYAVRVLNNAGSGSWASVICGVDWVVANAATRGIKVANMSLGGSGSDGNCSDGGLREAICAATAAGVTFVVAAGNSNANFSGFVPATYPEVLTVTAVADFNGTSGGGAAATCRTDVDDTYADFSNFAMSAEDIGHTIAGPGVCIYSTWKRDGYNTISGTSMASPHVAGTAALCIGFGACSGGPSQVIAKLRNDAAAQATSYGFVGDPNAPVTDGQGRTLYFGYLVYAGGY